MPPFLLREYHPLYPVFFILLFSSCCRLGPDYEMTVSWSRISTEFTVLCLVEVARGSPCPSESCLVLCYGADAALYPGYREIRLRGGLTGTHS